MAHTGAMVCVLCRTAIPCQFERVQDSSDPQQVLLRADLSPLVNHMAKCHGRGELQAGPAGKAFQADLKGRIDVFLDQRHFVSNGGSRACTMCGLKGAECMARLGRSRKGCCPACEAGNTHPAPGEAVGGCAQWAAENVGEVR